jgi:putative transposase
MGRTMSDEYRHHGHSVSTCKYHFVWTPKYRHSVLDPVKDELSEMFRGTADQFGHDMFALEIADDHVHLFVQADPTYAPSEIVKQFKGYSGRTMLQRFPDLKDEYFWGSGLWKDGYYVGTTGNVAADVVQRYIEETEH